MSDEPLDVVAGFREMWQPIYAKYRQFFDATIKISAVVNDIRDRDLPEHLAQVVGRMVFVAVNTYGAIQTLVLNGYGPDALKLSRSIYEAEVNIIWLKRHPEDLRDFLDYHFVKQKELYDAMDEEQQLRFSQEQREQIMADYSAVLPRFVSRKDKTRPRNEWCRESFYKRAKEAGQEPLYRAFYRPTSSMIHGDIAGLIAQLDDDSSVDTPPSFKGLDDALVNGHGSLVRCLSYFDEIAQFGFKDRLAELHSDYAAAVKSLSVRIGETPQSAPALTDGDAAARVREQQMKGRRGVTRGDWIALTTLFVSAIACMAAWLAVPGFQEWVKIHTGMAGTPALQNGALQMPDRFAAARALPEQAAAPAEKNNKTRRTAAEPTDSLRRRTLRLADDLDAFLAERFAKRPASPEEAGQYDQATINLYLALYKTRTVGTLQELQAKGLDVGSLNAPGAAPSRHLIGNELRQLRDLAYHLDANNQVVHF